MLFAFRAQSTYTFSRNETRRRLFLVPYFLISEAFMTDSRRGLIVINTGPGKGKTTAAMGTALRAVGNGMKVLMLQFLKGSWHYGELDAVQAFGENFVLKQMGRGFVKVGGAETDPEDIRRWWPKPCAGGRRWCMSS